MSRTVVAESENATGNAGKGSGPAARLARVAVVVAAALAAAAALAGVLRMPDPLPADAPGTTFSATRAHRLVEEISAAPHPVGTAEHDRVRDHLLAELTALGLRPELRKEVGVSTGDGAAMVAPAQNIEAKIRGTDPTGRVLLVAHYDSADASHGAADDGMGIATILEVVRALKAGTAPRNDIGILITDAEEPGLMGARAYVSSGGLADPSRTVVLNLEARGVSGRSVMFESGAHNGALLPALTEDTPVATSLSAAVYELLPNDTDFTVWREAGATGLNFAVMGESAKYHTPLDTSANADRSSLQDMGSGVLSATRHLAGQDLRNIQDGADYTYFTLFGLMVRYPTAFVIPLAGLAVAGLIAVLAQARRRGALRLRAVAVAAATVPVPLALAAVCGFVGWETMLWFRPEYAGFTLGHPYRAGTTAVGLCVTATAAIPLWVLIARRGRTVDEVSLGVTCWFALLAVVSAALLPGASYLFVWPALVGTASQAVQLALPQGSPWRSVCRALPLLPSAVLLVPVAALLTTAVGLALAVVPLVLVALALLPTGTLAPVTGRGRRLLVPAVATASAGILLTVGAVAADGVDARHPSQVSLLYTLNADNGTARWASTGLGTHPWADRLVASGHTRLQDEFPGLEFPRWKYGPAPVAPVARPTLQVLSTKRDGARRTVRLRLGTQGGASSRLALYADTGSAEVLAARTAGIAVPGGENRPTATSRWKWGLIQLAPSAAGSEVRLTVRGDRPLKLTLVAESPGLPATALGDKPDTVTWSADWSAQTLVSRSFRV
ncbi:M28 family peptidase [Streptomyces bottropensis]|uniref:M28 family peptidase n=1 Tax=Streptomyces bottropensis TaxID=42235 RepID=UPI003820E592